MKFLSTMRIAVSAIARNRARSLLTMLGIIIGVAAVIITVAIGSGARASVANQINGLGSNMLILVPGSVNAGGVHSGNGGASTLTPADGLAIAKLPHVAAVSPTVTARLQIVASQNNWQTSVVGVAPSYTFIRNWPMASGTFFSQSDVETASKAAVLGQTVATNLFPDGANPIGQTILVGNVPFVVTGVLSAKGQSSVGQDQDDTILVPYTSAQERLTGQTATLGSMVISADDAANITLVQNETTTLLEARHNIAQGGTDDFQVRNLADIASAASSTAATMQLLLAGVAAVSLLVGGIGIMNIMLVSVTERTREIGLRVAVGARRAAILWQFLAEAVVLATFGGAVGAAIGAAGSFAVAFFAKWSLAVDPLTVAIAVAFSALVGVFFGYYPAAKASQLDPIVALRFE